MNADALARFAIAAVHLLAASAMFGAMFYRLFVLTPRSHRFFATARAYENFQLALAGGMRWTFLAGLATIVVSGVCLVFLHGIGDRLWLALILAKSALTLLAFALFVYVSWRLWPRRVFAIDEELPAIEKNFQRQAVCMLLLTGLAMLLGIFAHAL